MGGCSELIYFRISVILNTINRYKAVIKIVVASYFLIINSILFSLTDIYLWFCAAAMSIVINTKYLGIYCVILGN
jgi:hypothetical protein